MRIVAPPRWNHDAHSVADRRERVRSLNEHSTTAAAIELMKDDANAQKHG
jgi:hypothetical protein